MLNLEVKVVDKEKVCYLVEIVLLEEVVDGVLKVEVKNKLIMVEIILLVLEDEIIILVRLVVRIVFSDFVGIVVVVP